MNFQNEEYNQFIRILVSDVLTNVGNCGAGSEWFLRELIFSSATIDWYQVTPLLLEFFPEKSNSIKEKFKEIFGRDILQKEFEEE